jgi:signal transduction histidine kinase
MNILFLGVLLVAAIIGFALGYLVKQTASKRRKGATSSQIRKLTHDLNNYLAAIFGFASAAQDDLEEDQPLRQDLEEILSAAGGARDVANKLHSLARQEGD